MVQWRAAPIEASLEQLEWLKQRNLVWSVWTVEVHPRLIVPYASEENAKRITLDHNAIEQYRDLPLWSTMTPEERDAYLAEAVKQ